MKDILIEGKRLRLRKADIDDLDYIIALEYSPENLKYIYPFNRDYHKKIFQKDNKSMMDIIIEEKQTREAAGYFMLRGLDSVDNGIEWTHVIIGRKGLGYGHEAMKLLKAWTFDIKKYHRGWLDCKEYNEVAIQLYESEGLIREGLMRETLLTDGTYENLIIYGMLEQEYQKRREDGKEL